MTLSQEEADAVFKIVDKVLTQVFGEKGTRLIYAYLESHYDLHPSEFAAKIDVFAKGLETFLNSGALIIERKIIKDIYSSYGLVQEAEFTRPGEASDFAGQVRFACKEHKQTA